MNEVLNCIKRRFSCRGYDGVPVEKAALDAIASAALAAPSAMNLQPWRVIVVNNKDIIDDMDADAMEILAANPDKSGYNRIMERGGKVFYNAPCLFLILKQPGPTWADVDCGIMTQNICLAADSLGLANVIVAMAAIPLNGPRGDEFKKRVGWTDDWEFGMGVLVGHGNMTKEPHELDMEKLSFVE